MNHLVPLGNTGWSVWRDVAVRSTGFPIDGLARFAAPDCAKAADAFLEGVADDFERQFELAVAAGAETCRELAGDPLFHEAVAWQNLAALGPLDGLRSQDIRRTSKWRRRERMVASYWQRYCAKNETIGFFGPAAWATVDPAATGIKVTVGDGLLRTRAVDFEYWPLVTLARQMAADPAIRPWLPPSRPAHLTLDGRQVSRPGARPVPLSAIEVAAIQLCDGRVAANAVVASLTRDGLVRTEQDGYLLLDRLAERGLLSWQGDLPQSLDAENALRALLGGIGDPVAQARAASWLDRMSAAKDEVTASVGDPDRLAAALRGLAEEFTAVTGVPAHRRAGETYAGRSVCFEDTARDIDVVVGGQVLTDIAEPMAIMLGAARWLTAELGKAYTVALREIYDDLAPDGGDVPLSDLLFFGMGVLLGTDTSLVDAVVGEFSTRWMNLFGLGAGSADKSLCLTPSGLVDAAAAAFPADRPGWTAARLHSPDLLLCAEDTDAVERGDYLVVLGELHVGIGTFASTFLNRWHPSPASLVQAMAEDTGEHRVHVLYPSDWPGYSARLAQNLDGPTDYQLGFAEAPVADHERLLPATSVLVDKDLVARAPDGRRWPLLDVVGDMISLQAMNGFKLVSAVPHTPRITIGKLVVARETWRTTVGRTSLAGAAGEQAEYVAVRRWRAALDLPDRVFVKFQGEAKPVYLDLTSPIYAGVLCAMARASGPEETMTITELLPDTGQHWLRDAAGQRYSSELRFQIVDPVGA
ncbi:lantibiotic dehydratase [Actinocrispum wychmicini]|uniref:Lantibiotic biosynthesis dehydratase-like protein n=1 Tax=Actinocrispum wychmicini TaxID=1213861 RepID=A0A4R2IKX1_9PSEU|nr:lantibiotic dehydratase [Actinocrispum wychmicini]TCO45317.1 lantibiotic biosynthesis dehydratase-like protein [Actinocrispum wychmicini]